MAVTEIDADNSLVELQNSKWVGMLAVTRQFGYFLLISYS